MFHSIIGVFYILHKIQRQAGSVGSVLSSQLLDHGFDSSLHHCIHHMLDSCFNHFNVELAASLLLIYGTRS